jgi:hypothetical protein
MGRPEQIKNIIDQMKEGRLGKSVTATFVKPFWGQIVGSTISSHCRPVEFRNNGLVIECDSSTWCSQISENQTLILTRITEKIGSSVIKKLNPIVKRQQMLKITGSNIDEPITDIPPKAFAWAESIADTAPVECRESLMRAMLATIKNKMRTQSRRSK